MPILDWIYPPRCISCRSLFAPFHNTKRPWLCEACKPLLIPISEAYCPRCGYPIGSDANTVAHISFCSSCRGKTFYFTSHRAAFVYDDSIRDMLHNVKFRSHRQTAQGLGHLLAEATADWNIEADYIVPIPLHPSKKRSRGFNQAEILARPLSKALGIPLAKDMIKRIKKTLPQSGLSASSREQNQSGAFTYNAQKYKGSAKTILLIDDIFTSGATMNACAKLLADNTNAELKALSLSIAIKDV